MRSGFAQLRRVPLVLFVALYTVVTGGPLLWVATMSLRTTAEIFKNPYGFPVARPLGEVRRCLDQVELRAPISGTARSSSSIAVALVTVIGAMAAHCLARYTFRGNRLVRFLILTGLVLPPQLRDPRAVPDPARHQPVQHADRAHPRLRGDAHRDDRLYPGRVLRADSAGSVSTPRGWTATPTSRSSGA